MYSRHKIKIKRTLLYLGSVETETIKYYVQFQTNSTPFLNFISVTYFTITGLPVTR